MCTNSAIIQKHINKPKQADKSYLIIVKLVLVKYTDTVKAKTITVVSKAAIKTIDAL